MIKHLDAEQVQELKAATTKLDQLWKLLEVRLVEQITKDKKGNGWRNPQYPVSSTFAGIRKDTAIIQEHFRSGKKATIKTQKALYDIIIRLVGIHGLLPVPEEADAGKKG